MTQNMIPPTLWNIQKMSLISKQRLLIKQSLTKAVKIQLAVIVFPYAMPVIMATALYRLAIQTCNQLQEAVAHLSKPIVAAVQSTDIAGLLCHCFFPPAFNWRPLMVLACVLSEEAIENLYMTFVVCYLLVLYCLSHLTISTQETQSYVTFALQIAAATAALSVLTWFICILTLLGIASAWVIYKNYYTIIELMPFFKHRTRLTY